MEATLLVELLTEELPPKSLSRLGKAFADSLAAELRQNDFLTERSKVQWFATPRRLAAKISNMVDKSPDKPIEVPGPSVKIGLDSAGKPTAALLGFAKKYGVDISQFEQRDTPRG